MSIVQNQIAEVRTEPLAVLAAEINQEHDAATAAAVSAIAHARTCGELLIKAKAEIGHGGFLPWLKANCRVKERQARNYMKVAANWATVIKSAPDAEMTVKGALKLLDDASDKGGDQITTVAELLTHIEDAAEEYKRLREGLASSETHRAIVDKHITEETLLRFGWDSCYRNVQDELTRVLARESELRSWFDDIAGAGQKRMDELGADEQVKLAKCEAVIAENIGKAKIPENSEFGLPAIIPTDCVLMGIIGDDHAEITPSATHPGYFWVSVCTGLSTLGTDFVFLRRPIRQDMVAMALQAARFSRDAYWGNLEWDGSKPWWTKDMDQCPPVRRASA